MQKIFNTTQSDLLKYNNTIVEVMEITTKQLQYISKNINIFHIKFYDNTYAFVYNDELSEIEKEIL